MFTLRMWNLNWKRNNTFHIAWVESSEPNGKKIAEEKKNVKFLKTHRTCELWAARADARRSLYSQFSFSFVYFSRDSLRYFTFYFSCLHLLSFRKKKNSLLSLVYIMMRRRFAKIINTQQKKRAEKEICEEFNVRFEG